MPQNSTTDTDADGINAKKQIMMAMIMKIVSIYIPIGDINGDDDNMNI